MPALLKAQSSVRRRPAARPSPPRHPSWPHRRQGRWPGRPRRSSARRSTSPFRVQVGDRDTRAFACQGQRRRPANTRPAAGYQGCLAVKYSRYSVPPCAGRSPASRTSGQNSAAISSARMRLCIARRGGSAASSLRGAKRSKQSRFCYRSEGLRGLVIGRPWPTLAGNDGRRRMSFATADGVDNSPHPPIADNRPSFLHGMLTCSVTVSATAAAAVIADHRKACTSNRDKNMSNRTGWFLAGALTIFSTLAPISLGASSAEAAAYCGPNGCVARPFAAGVRGRAAFARVGVGAPGVGIRAGTPMNRGGPVKPRLGRR